MGKFNQDNRSGSKRDFEQRDFGKQSFSSDDRRRKMYKAICSSCGKNCEVPFKPTGNKPVYCNECFKKNNVGDSRRFQDRNLRRPNFEKRYESRPQNNEQFEIINHKLDKMLKILTAIFNEEKEIQEKPKKRTIIAKKKTKKHKNKSPVTKE